LPFLDHLLVPTGRTRGQVSPDLTIESPDHMRRDEAPPTFVLREANMEVSGYELWLSPGGEVADVRTAQLEMIGIGDGTIELGMPEDLWAELETNVGYWWCVLGIDAAGKPLVRTPEVRCLIRHEALPRLEGSRLKYPDESFFSVVYLGGDRQVGWKERGELPHRPPLRDRGGKATAGPRFAKLRKNAVAAVDGRMAAEAYREMVGHVGDVLASALPEGAVALVATKGDDSLLRAEGRDLRHFPAGEAGAYAGYHPADDAEAIERLEDVRRTGAQFLVIPASMRWWLDHYEGFVRHLREGYGEPIVDDRERCTIFDLRKPDEYEMPDQGQALVELADRTLGYGGHHRMAFRRFHGIDDEAFPRFAGEAQGWRLVDSDGRAFVDWVSGGGPVILGYGHPAVNDAVTAQLAAGPTLTLTHPIEVEVATLLTRIIPCAEQVAFGKNGSDALAAAVRLARAVTGREMILQHGGHGFHDWFVASKGVPGVPKALGDIVRSFPYNDLAALEARFEDHEGEVAAVVMEPVSLELPTPGYLEGVKELARRHGALLVFDEVITAFRLGPGGAQARFGVVPDLACLGKGMANGMPLSAVVGRRKYMEQLPNLAYGMTFRGETLSLAAARAVIRLLLDVPVAEHLEQIGGQVRRAFDEACAVAGVSAQLLGPEARMTFVFGDQAAVPHERLEAEFVLGCARRQVLTNATILPSLAHDAEAVALTEAAFSGALEQVKVVVDAGAQAMAEAVGAGFERCGLPPNGPQRAPAGYIEAARDEHTRLLVRGWLLADDEGPCTIEFRSPHGNTCVADRLERPDVASVYEGVPGASQSGFAVALSREDFVVSDHWDFEIRAHRGDRNLFYLRVLRPAAHLAAEPLSAHLDGDGILHL
jgi:glutamate-1-semialdehyde 2,1-aminomutase/spore coat polysaccharide biosynthesis protein SpsF